MLSSDVLLELASELWKELVLARVREHEELLECWLNFALFFLIYY